MVFKNGTNIDHDYNYDAFGNMVNDKNKNITSITYNHLNLPKQITFANNNSIVYVYNALGVKLRKDVVDANTQATTHYMGSFQYNNNTLQYIHTAEGYVRHTPRPTGTSYGAFDYVYNYTDHLGNIRLSYTLDPSDQVLKILEENHYYPFGMKHSYNGFKKDIRTVDAEIDLNGNLINPTNNLTNFEPAEDIRRVRMVSNTGYQYKYNGKEYQDELGLNVYDYGYRGYDPAIGRWSATDPLAEKYIMTSPYAFVQNNPIINREIDGRYFEKGSKSERLAARIERKVEKRASKLERKADRLDAKGKSSGDLRDRVSELRQTGQDVRDMSNDQSTEYKYAKVNSKEAKDSGISGPTATITGKNDKGDNVMTMFTESNMDTKIHETRHGGQNSRGEFDASSGKGYGVSEEVSAYRAQYSWSGQLKYASHNIDQSTSNPINRAFLETGNIPPSGQKNINNIGGVNAIMVMDVGYLYKHINGNTINPLYPPQGITTSDFITN